MGTHGTTEKLAETLWYIRLSCSGNLIHSFEVTISFINRTSSNEVFLLRVENSNFEATKAFL
jgi:hypothetical protein